MDTQYHSARLQKYALLCCIRLALAGKRVELDNSEALLIPTWGMPRGPNTDCMAMLMEDVRSPTKPMTLSMVLMGRGWSRAELNRELSRAPMLEECMCDSKLGDLMGKIEGQAGNVHDGVCFVCVCIFHLYAFACMGCTRCFISTESPSRYHARESKFG